MDTIREEVIIDTTRTTAVDITEGGGIIIGEVVRSVVATTIKEVNIAMASSSKKIPGYSISIASWP